MLARALLLLTATLLASIIQAAHASEHDYTVKNVVRSIELGGSLTTIATAWTFSRPTEDLGTPFYAAFSESEWNALSSFEVAIDSPKPLRESKVVYSDAGPAPEDNSTHLVAVDLGQLPASPDEDITLLIKGFYTHLPYPLPHTAPQTGQQYLAWKGDAAIRSAYPVRRGRTQVTVTSTNVPDFAPESATKLGNKIKFGPYNNIPSYRDGEVQQGFVRFEHPGTVLTAVSVERTAEVSHWASNVAVEDKAWIRNDGPQLEGHFGRVDYQFASMRGQRAPTTISQVRVPLPPGAKDAYVVDTIGNVSTSRFGPVRNNPKLITRPVMTLQPHQASVLDLQPRYPLLGGWNYTFSYGFNLDAGRGGWSRVLETAGRFSVAVPFLTPIDAGTAYDDVTLKVVLPEGAEDVKVFVPFDVDSEESTITKTYLDSTGRQTVVLRKKNCTEQNSQLVYVQYSLSTFATLQKPVVVTLFTLTLLLMAALLRRFDLSIKSPKNKTA